MAYIGFLISKDEKNATVTAALGALAAVTLAILLVLGLELIDTAEPALRLPLMAMATFAAMFTARTFALGPISFLAGFVIVLLQSLVDDVPSPEALTRATLWTWVVVFVPLAVTIIVNLVFGQGAVAFMDRSVRKVLKECETSLANGEYRKSLPEWRARLLPLLETAQHSSKSGARTGRITVPVIRALLDALVVLEALPGDLPDDVREELASRLRACRLAIESDAAPAMDESLAPPPQFVDSSKEQSPAVIAVRSTLSSLLSAISHPVTAADKTEAFHPPRRPLRRRRVQQSGALAICPEDHDGSHDFVRHLLAARLARDAHRRRHLLFCRPLQPGRDRAQVACSGSRAPSLADSSPPCASSLSSRISRISASYVY